MSDNTLPVAGEPPLSLEEFKEAMPDHVRKNVNPHLMERINDRLQDPDMYEYYRNNLISYSEVLKSGKYKMESYLNAVVYCSHRLMGRTNLESYTKTFPDKVKEWQSRGMSSKDISAHVSAFNKTQLVMAILEQAMVPTWILNQDLFQDALNTQAELMLHAKSEKVRSDAANSLLTHLKPPEAAKIELDIGVKKDSSINALREATMALVAEQREAIRAGAIGATDAAKSRILLDNETGAPVDE